MTWKVSDCLERVYANHNLHTVTFWVICTKTIQSASCHHMWLHQTMKAKAKTLHTHLNTYRYMPWKVSACLERVYANHNIHNVTFWGYLL
jgi:hypothetical protein